LLGVTRAWVTYLAQRDRLPYERDRHGHLIFRMEQMRVIGQARRAQRQADERTVLTTNRPDGPDPTPDPEPQPERPGEPEPEPEPAPETPDERGTLIVDALEPALAPPQWTRSTPLARRVKRRSTNPADVLGGPDGGVNHRGAAC
jgi:hypothetical protein